MREQDRVRSHRSLLWPPFHGREVHVLVHNHFLDRFHAHLVLLGRVLFVGMTWRPRYHPLIRGETLDEVEGHWDHPVREVRVT